jgi:hypothetical protein
LREAGGSAACVHPHGVPRLRDGALGACPPVQSLAACKVATRVNAERRDRWQQRGQRPEERLFDLVASAPLDVRQTGAVVPPYRGRGMAEIVELKCGSPPITTAVVIGIASAPRVVDRARERSARSAPAGGVVRSLPIR